MQMGPLDVSIRCQWIEESHSLMITHTEWANLGEMKVTQCCKPQQHLLGFLSDVKAESQYNKSSAMSVCACGGWDTWYFTAVHLESHADALFPG